MFIINLLKKKSNKSDYRNKAWKTRVRFSVRHPLMVGHYSVRETAPDGTSRIVERRKKLTSFEQVAKFICDKGSTNGNLVITCGGSPFIETFGIYLHRIEDARYKAKLLEVLLPMQESVDNLT